MDYDEIVMSDGALEDYKDYDSQYTQQGDPIGTGDDSVVYQVIHKTENKKFVAKIMSYRAGHNVLREERRCSEEGLIISELRHSNIVAYKQDFSERQKGRFILITEYCDCKFSV